MIARAARTNGMASINIIERGGPSHPVRLAYIDTWRLLAVVLVIAGHLTWNQQLNVLLQNAWLAFFTYYARVGVFIFFFISGFVVSKTCLEELQEKGSFFIKGFYVRRAFRIIPPLLLYLVSCSILSGFGLIPFSLENFIGGSTYLCNTSFVECGYATHTWSLAFEEQFYLCFPLLFSFFVANRGPGAPIPIALAIASIPFFFGLPWIGQNGFIVIHALFYAGFLAARNMSYVERLAKAPYIGALVIVAALIVFFPIPSLDGTFAAKFLTKNFKFLYIPAIPILVLGTGIKGSILNKMFSFSMTSYLGRATYSIYLWQGLFTGRPFSTWSPGVQVLLIVILICCCVALFEKVERPLIKIGRDISDNLHSTPALPALAPHIAREAP